MSVKTWVHSSNSVRVLALSIIERFLKTSSNLKGQFSSPDCGKLLLLRTMLSRLGSVPSSPADSFYFWSWVSNRFTVTKSLSMIERILVVSWFSFTFNFPELKTIRTYLQSNVQRAFEADELVSFSEIVSRHRYPSITFLFFRNVADFTGLTKWTFAFNSTSVVDALCRSRDDLWALILESLVTASIRDELSNEVTAPGCDDS